MNDEISMDEALEAARRIGEEHGRNAASWVFDGNTPDETYAWVVRGLDAGDPEVYDRFREPSFSGEHAGDYTERELCDDIGVDYDLSSTEEADAIADAWLQAASGEFWQEIERTARRYLE